MSKRRTARHVVPPRPSARLLSAVYGFLKWVAGTTAAGIIGAAVSPVVSPLVAAWLGVSGN